MKKVLLFLLLSQPALAATLSLEGGDNVVLLDRTGRSCGLQVLHFRNGSDDLPAVKALIGSLHLNWQGPDLRLESMTVTLSGDGLENGLHQSVITGEELAYLWTSDNQTTTIKRGSRSTSPFCFFMLGGIKVSNKQKYFEGVGTVELKGSYEKNGEMFSAETTLPIRFHFTPIPKP